MFCTALLEYTFPCTQMDKKGPKTLPMEKRCRKWPFCFFFWTAITPVKRTCTHLHGYATANTVLCVKWSQNLHGNGLQVVRHLVSHLCELLLCMSLKTFFLESTRKSYKDYATEEGIYTLIKQQSPFRNALAQRCVKDCDRNRIFKRLRH